MKFLSKSTFAATLLAVACSAAFAKTEDLGELNSSGTYFGNTFTSAQSFADVYTFSIAADGDVHGATEDYSATVFFRDVNLTTLTLFSQPSGVLVFQEVSVPNTYEFTFGGLTAGSYSLRVTGTVSKSMFGAMDSASYDGFIATTAAVASPAPEASDFAMAVMGLAGVGLLVRRRKQAQAAA